MILHKNSIARVLFVCVCSFILHHIAINNNACYSNGENSKQETKEMTKRPINKQLNVNQVALAMRRRRANDVFKETGIAKRTLAKFYCDDAAEQAYSTKTIEALSKYLLDDLELLASECDVQVVY